MSTVSEALDWATEQLSESDDARLDSQVLLAYALNVSRTWLFTWPDKAPRWRNTHCFQCIN